jgi:WD40 repeat protein
MRRYIDSPVQSAPTRFDGVPERVSGRTTRVLPVAWEFLLAAVLLPGAATIFSSSFWGPEPGSRDRVALVGHTQLVEAVAFSPDGRTLASCGWDNSVRLWDLSRSPGTAEAEPVTLPDTTVRFALAFSPDGSLLASAGDGSVTIWSCGSSFKPVAKRAGVTYRCLAYSADGRTLALGGEDSTIRLWDMPAASERMVLRGHADVVKSIAFSPDGKLLVSSSQEGRVVLWDAASGTELRTLMNGGPNPVRFVTFTPDGKSVVLSEVAWDPREVVLVDVQTGKVQVRLPGHRYGVNAIAFAPDGRTLATAGVDRCIKLWDRSTWKELVTLVDDVGWVKSISFSPDGAWLAYCGNDATVRLWDLKRQQPRALGRLSSLDEETTLSTS